MKKFIGKFHYLTHDSNKQSHIQQTRMACEAGANWIQYRCFSKTDDLMMKDLNEMTPICDDWGTTLIVTQHANLLNYGDIQGVHIENPATDIQMIRDFIGPDKTLGASANTIEEILEQQKNSADYVGCGPFAHTNTKPNNYPHWGVSGYKNVIDALNKLNIKIPLIAAGGIQLQNIEALLQTGIHGIAVSAAVNNADSPKLAFKDIYQAIF